MPSDKPQTSKGSPFAQEMTQEQRDDCYDGRRIRPPQTTPNSYRVLEEYTLSNLEQHVMQHLNLNIGWRCTGGVYVLKDTEAFPNGRRYFQAMVRA